MRHGDISNQSSPILAFNVDNLLFKEAKEKGFAEKLKDKILGEEYTLFNRKLNMEFLDQLRELWRRDNYSIYLITFMPYRDKIEQILDTMNVSYTRLEYQEDMEMFRQECINQFLYYFDTDVTLLSYLSYKGAVNYATLHEKVGRQHGN